MTIKIKKYIYAGRNILKGHKLGHKVVALNEDEIGLDENEKPIYFNGKDSYVIGSILEITIEDDKISIKKTGRLYEHDMDLINRFRIESEGARASQRHYKAEQRNKRMLNNIDDLTIGDIKKALKDNNRYQTRILIEQILEDIMNRY